MTEDQNNKYKEAAKEYALRNAGVNSEYISEKSFMAGAEHAHSEGKKDGWNEVLEAIEKLSVEASWFHSMPLQSKFLEELNKLKR